MEDVYTVILAAGEGKRMDSIKINKVALEVAGKPMILRTIDTLKEAGIKNIIVVIGFAKDSVISILPDDVKTVEQVEQLGTGDAVRSAMQAIPKETKYILVLYGDDSYIYSPDNFQTLIDTHIQNSGMVTFLTANLQNPQGLGRVKRDINGQVQKIIEEKNATDEEKEIKEANLGGFLFNSDFLRQNIDKIQKNEETGEFFLTDIIEVAKKQNLAVGTLKLDNLKWRGVNTPKELEEAQGILNE